MQKKLILSNKFAPLSKHNLDEFKLMSESGVTYFALPSANLINQAKKMLLTKSKNVLIKSNILSLARLAEMVVERELVWHKINQDQSLALVSKVVLKLEKEGVLNWFSQLDSVVESVEEIHNIIMDLKNGGAGSSIELADKNSDREKDLILIYNTYQDLLLNQKLIDQVEVFNQAIRILSDSKNILGKNLLIYSYELSAIEQKFISSLEGFFESIKIYYHYDLDNNDLFKDNNKTLSKFREDNYTVSKQEWKSNNISDYLFRDEIKKYQGSVDISVKGYFSKAIEVKSALLEVKKLIINNYSPKDIAIVSYNLKEYQPLLEYYAKHYKLPLDNISVSLEKQTFIKKLLLPLNLKRLDFPKETFLELLRLPLSWPESLNPGLLSKFITLSPFDNSISKWQQACNAQQAIKDDNMIFSHNELFKISQSLIYIKNLFNKIPNKGNFNTMTSAVLEILDILNFKDYILKKLEEYEDSQSEKMYSLWQSFNLFVYQENEFDLWPDEMTFNEFFEIFKRSISKSLSNKETLIDQTIDVLNPYQIAGLRKDYVFMLGANEGTIPSSTKSWIRGIEVDELENLPLSINHNELLFQKGLFLRLVDSPVTKFFISYIVENYKGEEHYLSPFVIDILEIINQETIIDGRIWPELENVANESELQQVLANLKLVDYLNEKVKLNSKIEKLRENAIASVYNGVMEAKDIKKGLSITFSDYYTMSTSMLEEYGKCPFSFMMNRVFSLKEAEEFEIGITPLKRGLIIHSVLARFLNGYLDTTLKSNNRDKYTIELINILEDELNKTVNTSAISNQWVELEKKRFNYILREWLNAEIELQEKSQFRPSNLEQSFKHQLELDNSKLNYTGFIDRIDKKGDKFIIYDYKTGSPPKMEDIYDGVAFQLPLYIKATYNLTNLSNSCGGGYYQINSNFNRSKGMWKESCLDDVDLSKRIKDYLEEEKWNNLIDETIHRAFEYRQLMRDGYFPLMPRVEKVCSYCPYKDICRLTKKLDTRLEEANEVY